MFELVHFMFNLLEMTKRRECGLMHGCAGLEMDVLGKETEAYAARAYHLTLVGLLLTVNQSKHRGLAGSVSSDQTDVLAGIDLH
jgi:hypothetical protein